MMFPFPQNREASRCTYPTDYRNADVMAAYRRWYDDTVTSNGAGGHLRIRRTKDYDADENVDSTVSEGIGYGMLIAVYMNDQHLFDELWKYEQQWLNPNGLMDWRIKADGSGRLGTGAATDADEDMAFALVLADKQWGGKGSLSDSYANIAKTQIDNIWKHEIIDGKLANASDNAFGGWGFINISYFAPAYYRVFKDVSGNNGWDDVIKTVYDTLDDALMHTNTPQDNGLVPAWWDAMGKQAKANGDGRSWYQYDSCRTPFRIALDWCWNGEARAQAYMTKTSAFFSSVGADALVDGYNLDGSPHPQYAVNGDGGSALVGQSAAFMGPAAVGAMVDRKYRGFMDAAYKKLKGLDLVVGGTYYDDSWNVMSLLMLSANFLDYTSL
jgi:endo-1,4-beta-D-glucanase Y